jgi:hypothetical protein
MITASDGISTGEFASADRQWDAAMGATVFQSKTLAVIPDEEQILSEDLYPDRSAPKLARQHRRIPIVAKSQRGLVVTRPGTRSRPALAVLIACVDDVRFHSEHYP